MYTLSETYSHLNLYTYEGAEKGFIGSNQVPNMKCLLLSVGPFLRKARHVIPSHAGTISRNLIFLFNTFDTFVISQGTCRVLRGSSLEGLGVLLLEGVWPRRRR